MTVFHTVGREAVRPVDEVVAAAAVVVVDDDGDTWPLISRTLLLLLLGFLLLELVPVLQYDK